MKKRNTFRLIMIFFLLIILFIVIDLFRRSTPAWKVDRSKIQSEY